MPCKTSKANDRRCLLRGIGDSKIRNLFVTKGLVGRVALDAVGVGFPELKGFVLSYSESDYCLE